MPPLGWVRTSVLKTSVLKRPAAARSEEEHEEEPEDEEEEEEVAESAAPTPQQTSGRGRGRGRGSAVAVSAAQTPPRHRRLVTQTPPQVEDGPPGLTIGGLDPQEPSPLHRRLVTSTAEAPWTPRTERRIAQRNASVTSTAEAQVEASPASSASRALKATASAGGDDRLAVVTTPEYTGPRRLDVPYELPADVSGAVALGQGLVRLRRANQLCDVTVVSAGGRIPVHRVVLAAQSDTLAERLQSASSGDAGAELRLVEYSFDAVDLVVRWLYGEVAEDSFSPSDATANEEILKLASELGLPRLAELCALQLAADADVSNVVARVRLCEEFGLPRLRANMISSVLADRRALDAVAKDQTTLSHPALMRELLAAIATKANEGEDDPTRAAKKLRARA